MVIPYLPNIHYYVKEDVVVIDAGIARTGRSTKVKEMYERKLLGNCPEKVRKLFGNCF